MNAQDASLTADLLEALEAQDDVDNMMAALLHDDFPTIQAIRDKHVELGDRLSHAAALSILNGKASALRRAAIAKAREAQS